MIPETIYSKYSQAMFDIASEQKKLTEFGTELKGVRDTFQENPDLWKFLNHPLVPPQSKKRHTCKDFQGQPIADRPAVYVRHDRPAPGSGPLACH